MQPLENQRQRCILMDLQLMTMAIFDSVGELNVIGYTLDEVRVRVEKQLLSNISIKKQYFL
jgi:hypothetical protein